MAKILKNTTASIIDLTKFGVTVPAAGQITIVPQDYPLLAMPLVFAELSPLITAGSIVVNDGTNNLSVARGLDYLSLPDYAYAARFNNATNGFASTDVQTAIEEVYSHVSGFTPGSVIFAGSTGILAQDNANLFYDNTNNRLGIGTAVPLAVLHVAGGGIFGGVDGGTPSAFTIRGPVASGTNIAGANWTFDASNGTGTGGSGAIIFRTAASGTPTPMVVNSTQALITNANSATFSHSITGGSNRLLVLQIAAAFGVSITGVTYAGIAMTNVAAQNGANSTGRGEVWYLLAPPIGTANVVATFSTFQSCAIEMINLTSVNQTTPFATGISTSGSGTTVSVTPTTSVGQIVLDLVTQAGTTTTQTASQTNIWTATAPTTTLVGNGDSKTATAGTTTVSYSFAVTANYSLISLPINAVSVSGVDALTETMRIAGGRVGIGTSSPLAPLDVTGIAKVDSLQIDGSASGTLTLNAANTTTSYGVKMPPAQGALNNTLINDGAGNLSWNVPQISVIEVSDTANATTTSGTDALLTTMTITASAGTYLLFFNTSITSNNAGAAITVSVYNNGVQDASTVMKIAPFDGGTLSATTARGAVGINRTVTVTTGAVQIRWSTSGGTATCGPRVLSMMRIA